MRVVKNYMKILWADREREREKKTNIILYSVFVKSNIE